MTERAPTPVAEEISYPADPRTIPVWLAALVLVLLAGVLVAGFWIVRDRVISPRSSGAKFAVADATQQLIRKVSADPENVQARLDLGYAYQLKGEYDQALEQYAEALKRDSRNTAALYNTGVILLRQKHGVQAEAKLRLVLRIDPAHVLAAKELGQYYASTRQWPMLVAIVKPVVKAAPQMADLQYLLGFGYEKTGDTARAARHYKAALLYTPDLPEALKGLDRLGVAK